MSLVRGAGIAAMMLTVLLFVHPEPAPAGSATVPLETVDNVDLDRYAGTWHEIARLPNRFQKQCVAEVSASYELREDGTIGVLNRCRKANGDYDEAHGVARVVDPATRSRLKVSFVSLFGWQLFWGDYWIIDLDPDYRHVVIATPSRRYAWVLARTESISSSTRAYLHAVLRKAGYDPGGMRWVKDQQEENADAADQTL